MLWQQLGICRKKGSSNCAIFFLATVPMCTLLFFAWFFHYLFLILRPFLSLSIFILFFWHVFFITEYSDYPYNPSGEELKQPRIDTPLPYWPESSQRKTYLFQTEILAQLGRLLRQIRSIFWHPLPQSSDEITQAVTRLNMEDINSFQVWWKLQFYVHFTQEITYWNVLTLQKVYFFTTPLENKTDQHQA